jgi:hypothetical protein
VVFDRWDMTRTGSVVVTLLLLVTLAAAASAQTPAAPPPAPPAAVRPLDRSDLRNHIYVMEGALARAVSFGAQRLNREIRSVMPELVALSGEPQARGVYLEGYGVFFDVGVPILHQSMVWSMTTMLKQDPKGVTDALNLLKQIAKESDGPRRTAAENAIARLELQIGPLMNSSAEAGFPAAMRPSAPAVGAALVPPGEMPPANAAQAPPLDKKYLQDPNAINRAYTESVQRALVDAMIDYSVPMAIAPDEFLTVGARDNMQRDTLAPADPYEEVVTILLRIKGSDLAAYRAGQIDRVEVRKRVQIKEF